MSGTVRGAAAAAARLFSYAKIMFLALSAKQLAHFVGVCPKHFACSPITAWRPGCCGGGPSCLAKRAVWPRGTGRFGRQNGLFRKPCPALLAAARGAPTQKPEWSNGPAALAPLRLSAGPQPGMPALRLLTVVLVGHGELLAALGTARSQHAAAIFSLHSLAETVLVHSPPVMRLIRSFHLSLFFIIVIVRTLWAAKVVIFFKSAKLCAHFSQNFCNKAALQRPKGRIRRQKTADFLCCSLDFQ